MVFSSTVFLFLFLPITLIIYYNPIFKGRSFRNVFLLLASLGFYAWGEPLFVFLMILSIFITWMLGFQIEKSHSKRLLSIAICYHVLILFSFKYLTFFSEQINKVLHNELIKVEIALPIGISFFTFQLMSYLFDIYYGNATAQKNPLYVGLYVSFFPQLIAGPIVRYRDIEDQIQNRMENKELFCEGICRFSLGLGKKLLLADYLALLADMMFSSNGTNSILSAWLGAIAYTLQIYFDFSGYSDMAIGLGKMFGFSINENFNYPYIADSVTDFWRRWHISLSTWFRDYVYIPLGGNRVSKCRWILNLFIVWLLTGIWHGANWTFILWGMIYFVFLLFEKTTGFQKKIGFLSHVYTGMIVIITWVVFRAENVSSALLYIKNMFDIDTYSVIDSAFLEQFAGSAIILVIAFAGSTPLLRTFDQKAERVGLQWVKPVYCLCIFVLSMMQAISSTYSPFIYFNF